MVSAICVIFEMLFQIFRLLPKYFTYSFIAQVQTVEETSSIYCAKINSFAIDLLFH